MSKVDFKRDRKMKPNSIILKEKKIVEDQLRQLKK